jgi:5-methylcytosine-specific restriction protein A
MGVCPEPGCPELTPCTRHPKRDKRPTARQRGYDTRWERTRARFLAKHPDCERCGQPSTEAHHRDGLGPDGPLGHADRNLEALCKPCHSQHTASQPRARPI